MKRRFRLSVVAIALAVVVGCQGAPDRGVTPLVPSSSGSHSPSASESSVTPTPNVSTPSKQELLAEAEKTYRAYAAETFKLDEAGGADQLPPAVTQYLAEPYQTVVEKSYIDVKASGITIEHMDRAVVKSIKEINASSQPEALIAITACVDATNAIVHEPNGRVGGGNIIVRQLYFKRVDDGTLRIFYGTGDEVDSC